MPPPDRSLNDRINRVIEGAEEALSPEEQYKLEQRSLHSGGANDIVIDAPKEPEVNPIIYRDVESLIFRGFLILPTQINGVDFIFKSINHHEFEYIQWVSGSFGVQITGAMAHYGNLR